MSYSPIEIRSIRWLIHSYINDVDSWKSKFKFVLDNMIQKHYYNTNVLPRVKTGARLVVREAEGLCNNCYHYGMYYKFNYDYNKNVCLNHVYDVADHWMSYEEFRETARGSFPESYEEYKRDSEMEEGIRALEQFLMEEKIDN